MRPFSMLAVVAFVALVLLSAVAYGRMQKITVEIRGEDDRTPITGAKVELLDPDGNLLGSGTTGPDGLARIEFELPDDVERIIVVSDAKNAAGAGTAYDLLTDGLGNPFGFRTYAGNGTLRGLVAAAKRAIAKCDKAEYDRRVSELRKKIAELEALQQTADAYAQSNNLRNTDNAGARKDLQRATKAQAQLDPSLRNPEVLDAIREYIALLDKVEGAKPALEAARQALDSIPPFPEDCKKDKFGMAPAPGGCEDEKLFGGLGSLLGLPVACDREPNRRKDTDRKSGGKERDHERD